MRRDSSASGRPGLEPPPGNPKFVHLDGVRGLTPLVILAVHGFPYATRSAGPAWVHVAYAARVALPLFFLLSGFLLYRPFVAARAKGSARPSATVFWRRRLLRVIPGYWVALTLLAIWPGLPGVFGADGWRYYTFLYVYRQHTVTGGLVPAWTLCVDMTFYLVLPFFAALMDRVWRRVGERRAVATELGVLAAMWAVGVVYWFVLLNNPRLPITLQQVRATNLVANLDWLAIGMAFAVVSVADLRAPGRLTRLLLRRHAVPIIWGAALVAFAFLARYIFVISQPVQHLLAGVLCAAAFAPACLVGERRGGILRVLAYPAVMWLGVISYGVYLYHPPVLQELNRLGIKVGTTGFVAYISLVLAAIAGSVIAGTTSYYLIERPILRYKNRPVLPRQPRPRAAESVEPSIGVSSD